MRDNEGADLHRRPPRTDDGVRVGPYVEAQPPVPVQVLVRGEQLPGHVLGWRRERVYVRYRTSMGQHLAWVAGNAVLRCDDAATAAAALGRLTRC